MEGKIEEPPLKPKPDPEKAPVERHVKETPTERDHVHPTPRDVSEAPAPNPNGNRHIS